MHCHSTLVPSGTSYLNRATNFAAKKWEELDKAPAGSMKKKLHGAGSKVLEKIEHQEVFLKGVPSKTDMGDSSNMVPFMYPSALREAKVREELAAFVGHRVPYHRKYMIFSALWVPVTALFTIVPLVPNIPFFYNAFRLWSHWKAYNGAKHLDHCIKNGSAQLQASDVLNLGLQHDPEFAVFFTGSYQLSKRRHAVKRFPQNSNDPIISESSGEITSNMQQHKPHLATKEGSEPSRPNTTTAAGVNDPLSVTDHVALEGFISDAEIQKICLAFGRIPMHRTIQSARFQEADKYVKDRLTVNGRNKEE